MAPGQVILFLIGMIVIIFGAYYVTYFIGVKASGQSRGRLKNKHITLVDRFSIARDKSFCLVEIAGKVYVIGITHQNMTLIDTLDAEAFAETVAERGDTQIWPTIPGGSFVNKMTKKLAVFIAGKMGRTLDFDESPGGSSFAENMQVSRDKYNTVQSDDALAERSDDPGDQKDPENGSE